MFCFRVDDDLGFWSNDVAQNGDIIVDTVIGEPEGGASYGYSKASN
jgi:hypothetical protein